MPVMTAPFSVATGTSIRIAPLRAGTSNSHPTAMITTPIFRNNPSSAASPGRADLFSRSAVGPPRLTTSTRAAPLPPEIGRCSTKSEENSTRPAALLGALSMSAMTALRGFFGSTANRSRPTTCSQPVPMSVREITSTLVTSAFADGTAAANMDAARAKTTGQRAEPFFMLRILYNLAP